MSAKTRTKRPPEKQFLSNQQSQIIMCIKAGLKNKDIAAAMSLNEKTVSTHVRRIYRKFGLDLKKNVHYLITKLDEMGKIE